MTVLANLSPSQQAELSAAVSASPGDAVARGVTDRINSLLASANLGGSPLGSTANLTQMATAIKAGACTVAFVGHSIMEGQNQNWPEAAPAKIFERMLRAAFPECAFTFVNLSLGGRYAAQFANTSYNGTAAPDTPSTGFFRSPQGTTIVSDVWHKPDLTLNGSTSGKSWRQHVVDAAPDFVLFLMDLNESAATGGLPGFVAAMTTILTDFQTGTAWNTKRPSIAIGTSHTGEQNRALILSVHRAIRGFAAMYGIPLFDAGRLYEILTTGLDVTNYDIYGEAGFRYNGGLSSASTFSLDPVYWSMEGGFSTTSSTVFSPTGSTLRANPNTDSFRLYRKRVAYDGRVTAQFTPGGANTQMEIFLRRDPAVSDNKIAAQYVVAIAATTVTLSAVKGDGTTTRTVVQTANLDAAVAQNAVLFVQAEAVGATIRVRINGKTLILARDVLVQSAGWFGIGQPVQGQGLSVNVGTNLSNAFSIEFLDPALVTTRPPLTPAQLLGTVNDFPANPDSIGGNTLNHMTTAAYPLIYTPAFIPLIRQIQAAVTR